MVSHSENIHKPIAFVWEHFIYKIDHPEHFVPGVSNVIIKEKTPEYVMRAMDIILPDGAKASILEKITHTPYHVKFTIIDHPVYTGYVDNFAEQITDTETKITFALSWVNKKTGEAFSNQDLAKQAVLKTVNYMLQSK